jgi:NDP-sugar pyrophosphorylase family protein
MVTLSPVIILAGGLATRLRPMTETVPKSLVSVNGEPFINHQLRLVRQQGVRKVVLCLGYLGEMVEEAVGNGQQFGLSVQYSYDGPKLLGTAGAIRKALSLIDDTFFVLYGDSYLACEYVAVEKTFLSAGKKSLMTVFHNRNQWDKSNVEYQNGRILVYNKRDFTEKMNHIDYGLGMFHRCAFDHVEAEQEHDLSVVYQDMLKKGELSGFEVNERFYEVGSFVGIRELEYYLCQQELLCNL